MKKLVAAMVLMVAIFAGALTIVSLATMTATPAEAAACRCPLLYAPVVCDRGKVYPNLCVAECHNAKNCVPTGEL